VQHLARGDVDDLRLVLAEPEAELALEEGRQRLVLVLVARDDAALLEIDVGDHHPLGRDQAPREQRIESLARQVLPPIVLRLHRQILPCKSSGLIRFPGESAEYRAARDRLLEQEIELRRATEAVAAARRELPPGGVGGSCPQAATPTSATTSARPRRESSGRCSTCSTATGRRSATSGAPSSSTRRPSRGRILATSAPSSRSGICST